MEKDKEYMGIQYPHISTPTQKAPDKEDTNKGKLPQHPAMDKDDFKNEHGRTNNKDVAERTKPEPQLSEAIHAPYDETPNDAPEQRDTAGTVATLSGVPMLYPNEMPKKKPRTRTFKKTVKNKLL
jgi:hypothetical protein